MTRSGSTVRAARGAAVGLALALALAPIACAASGGPAERHGRRARGVVTRDGPTRTRQSGIISRKERFSCRCHGSSPSRSQAAPSCSPGPRSSKASASCPTCTDPTGLPIGFAARPLGFPSVSPYNLYTGQWVGLTCAACHTGELRVQGERIRIEGGPAHIDVTAFTGQLAQALQATLSQDARRQRFVERVLASDTSLAPEELLRRFHELVATLGRRAQLFAAARGLLAGRTSVAGTTSTADPATAEPLVGTTLIDEARAAELRLETPTGLGRLDAVQRGGNLILAPLGDVSNYAQTTAPVRYPAIWDTPYLDWVLYNGSIRQPLARNIVEALGVGAPFNPATILSDHIAHSVLMDNIIWIHGALKRLQSPPWPWREGDRQVNAALAGRGQAIYEQRCASCHAVIDRQTHLPASYDPDAPDPIRVTMVPLDRILTDPRQAMTLAVRHVSLGKIGGPANIAYTEAVRQLTSGIVEQWRAQSAQNASIADAINGGRNNEIIAPLAYRARPLNGIWAMAPYLHNGSVPSLHALLLPPQDRPAKFCVGNWEFDPVDVGLDSNVTCGADREFDPFAAGNSNAGHLYGTDLGEPDRRALIEYLKTL